MKDWETSDGLEERGLLSEARLVEEDDALKAKIKVKLDPEVGLHVGRSTASGHVLMCAMGKATLQPSQADQLRLCENIVKWGRRLTLLISMLHFVSIIYKPRSNESGFEIIRGINIIHGGFSVCVCVYYMLNCGTWGGGVWKCFAALTMCALLIYRMSECNLCIRVLWNSNSSDCLMKNLI